MEGKQKIGHIRKKVYYHNQVDSVMMPNLMIFFEKKGEELFVPFVWVGGFN